MASGKVEQFHSGADVGAFVLDLGSLFVRAGNAGDDSPKHFCYSCIGQPTSSSCQESIQDTPSSQYPLSFSVMKENMVVKPCLKRMSQDVTSMACFPTYEEVTAPIEPYEIDEQVFEIIVKGIFRKSCDDLAGKPILVTEQNCHNRRVREKMAEVLFETFDVEALYVVKRAVLSCFAIGRTSGLVVNTGSTSTSIVPVIDGYTLQKNIIELPIGGSLLDYQLKTLLKAYNNLDSKIIPIYSVRKTIRAIPNFSSIIADVSSVSSSNCTPSFLMYSHRQVLRHLRESISRVSEDPIPQQFPISTALQQQRQEIRLNVAKHTIHNVTTRYELPDGTTINGEEFAVKIPEVIFNFSWLLNSTVNHATPLPDSFRGTKSLVDAAAQCVLECDVDARKDLLSSITFTGGCALIPGFCDRAILEFQNVEKVFGSGVKYKVISPSSSIEKRFLQWIGGSILASLACFQQMWVSKNEYIEHGSDLLERRCIQ